MEDFKEVQMWIIWFESEALLIHKLKSVCICFLFFWRKDVNPFSRDGDRKWQNWWLLPSRMSAQYPALRIYKLVFCRKQNNSTKCIWDLDKTFVKVAVWLFLSHFRTHLNWVLFFTAAGRAAKNVSSLKWNRHWKVKSV